MSRCHSVWSQLRSRSPESPLLFYFSHFIVGVNRFMSVNEMSNLIVKESDGMADGFLSDLSRKHVCSRIVLIDELTLSLRHYWFVKFCI